MKALFITIDNCTRVVDNWEWPPSPYWKIAMAPPITPPVMLKEADLDQVFNYQTRLYKLLTVLNDTAIYGEVYNGV